MSNVYHCLKRKLFFIVLLIATVLSSFSGMANAGKAAALRDTIIPVINSFSPASANTGDIVRIYGKYLKGASAVSFGGTPATYVGTVSDSEIVAIVGNGSSGIVSVTAPYGIATRPGFTYLADTFPPVVSYFTPDSGKLGTTVMIYGVHFTKTNKVAFGGVNAISFTVLNDSTITAKVATGASGNVAVTTPFGTGAKSGFVFITGDTVLTVINSFSPASANTGDIVRIYGKYLSGASAVSFGGTTATYVGTVSDSEIVAIVGNGSSGIVSVTAPYGIATKAGFTYIPDSTTLVRVNTAAETSGQDKNDFKLGLYPNPAAAYVIAIHPASSHPAGLQLIDISGRVVRIIKVGANTVQTKILVNGLITGAYKLVWSDGKNKISNTLLVK